MRACRLSVFRIGLLAAALATCTAVAAADRAVPTGPLPRNVVPSLVRLDLKLDPKQTRFSGTARIDADVAQATRTVWMHGRHLTIAKAEAVLGDGRRIPLRTAPADVSGVLEVTAATPIPAGKVTFEFAYDAPFGELQGAYRVKPDGRDYVITQMEALGARDTFPGFDEPSFKQPWELTLTVPADDVAVANTREVATEPLADGWKRVRFARTEALPSYLIAFAVGPWDVVAGPAIPPNGERTAPLALRGIAAQGQGARMHYSLQHTPEIVTALEDYFGIPYPFDKLDNVAAPDFWAGAMENAGLIVYRDTLMFPDETSPPERRQALWGVSAHELAHQWFGDLVTTRWWDDIWLNEGFATWMGTKISTQLQPTAHADRRLLEGAIEAMTADSLASTRRIHEPIKDFTDIQSAFDGITYQKGASMLGMFERYIGEEKFRDGIRGYLRQHARGNATSADLVQALAAQSSDPPRVAKAFFSYIDQPGVPMVHVDLDCAGAKPALVVRQQRYLPLGSTAKAEQTWGIPMCVRYGDGRTVHEQCSLIEGAQARIELDGGRGAAQCPTWVMPNAHGNGYYRYTLTPKLQDALSGAFTQLDAREQRMAADSTIAALDAGALTPQQFVAALPQFTGGEMRQTVTAGQGQVRWMDRHLFADDAARKAFRAGIAAIYRPRLEQLGTTFKSDDSDDARLLRSALIGFFAQTLKDPAVRGDLARQGRAGLGLDGAPAALAAMTRDVREEALAVAVEDGGVSAFDAAERLFRASDDAELRGELLSALGSARDPKLAERARALVLEPKLLRRNEITKVLSSQVASPETRPAARTWLDQHFETLNARLAPAGARLLELYNVGMCSTAEADDLKRRFTARMRTVEGGPLGLRQSVEAAQLCAALWQAQRGHAPKLQE